MRRSSAKCPKKNPKTYIGKNTTSHRVFAQIPKHIWKLAIQQMRAMGIASPRNYLIELIRKNQPQAVSQPTEVKQQPFAYSAK